MEYLGYTWEITSKWNDLPEESGVYAIREDFVVVYIGMAKNIKSRFYLHEILKKIRNNVSVKDILFHRTIDYKSIERKCLKIAKPKFNTNIGIKKISFNVTISQYIIDEIDYIAKNEIKGVKLSKSLIANTLIKEAIAARKAKKQKK